MYVLILSPCCFTFWLQGGMMVNILAANGSILHALLGSQWQLTNDSTYVASAYICLCMCMVVVHVRLLARRDIYLCFLLIVHACIYCCTFMHAYLVALFSPIRRFYQQVTLPGDFECERCTLQLVRQAAEWTAPGGGYRFWSCADVSIVNSSRMSCVQRYSLLKVVMPTSHCT